MHTKLSGFAARNAGRRSESESGIAYPALTCIILTSSMDDEETDLILNDDNRSIRVLLRNLIAAHASSGSRQLPGGVRVSFYSSNVGQNNADADDALDGAQHQDGEEELVDDDDDPDFADEDDNDEEWYPTRRSVFTYPPASSPRPAGVKLIKSGEFGRVAPKIRARRNQRNLSTALNNRLSTPHPSIYREDYASGIVPNSNGVIVANYDANIYTAQFSKDFRLHIYDQTAPPQQIGSQQFSPRGDHHLQTTMNVSRRIQGEHGRWTITDANLSPDNDSTREDNPAQIPIPFHDPPGTSRRSFWDSGSFGLFSCRFSADGNEVIAGGHGHIYVYDLLANKRSVKIQAHADDVNSCCWADTSSGNVLVSASDDSFLKVWDRRSLGSSPKPSGVLIGHTEGITYVSAKGDGRYIVSNGKDQAMRLWDLRKMRTNAEYERVSQYDYGVPNFDYRPPEVNTYTPALLMGGFMYSAFGSHIWSLDGTLVQVLDRQKTLPIWTDSSGVEYPARSDPSAYGACVRDVSWSSQQPALISAAWESQRHGSTLARHEWKGLSKMSNSLQDWEERRRQEGAEMNGTSRRSTRIREQTLRRLLMPGTFIGEDAEENDEL
ncbi:hypothetical protein D9757_002331 [Collybiopsis confluens]|uniref:WD40 repeat-like protein n=1 Tax=Collybiopsis confluens TaxID=2823264 RepID=A0A8H5I063_9AGAR|nr:hypothetical protein D9757_002331 [Collybiopsis confluens]